MPATDPYSAPKGDLERDENNEVGEIRFFSPAGRIGRIRMLAHYMLVSLASYVIVFIFAVVVFALGLESSALLTPLIFFGGTFYLGFIVIFWIFMIQRLHDINKSGWLSILCLVPFVNIVYGLCLLFIPGSEGTNNYGGHPPPNRWWHWVLGLALPIIFIATLITFAIPAYQGYTLGESQNNTFENNPL